jgi:hypothetical protein
MLSSRWLSLILLACLGLVFTTSACVHSRYTEVTLDRLRDKLGDTTVVVNAYTPAQQWEEVEGLLSTSRSATAAYLNQFRIFKQVLLAPPPNPEGKVVVVEALLNDFRIVHGAARFFGGAMAGSSYMNYHVRLVDGAGQPITDQLIESANDAYAASWSHGASDQSLPHDMGGVIGEYIIQTLELLP